MISQGEILSIWVGISLNKIKFVFCSYTRACWVFFFFKKKLNELILRVKGMYVLILRVKTLNIDYSVHPEFALETTRGNWNRQVLILWSNQVWGLRATQQERQTGVSKTNPESQGSRAGTLPIGVDSHLGNSLWRDPRMMCSRFLHIY